MDSIQDFSKVVLSLDNCVIPSERLRNTPSSKDGCPHDLEVDLRIVGCEHIQTAGALLRLPQVAMATAQVLFQRFFYSKSLIKYNMMHVAMACIFLAAKIEENCRRVRDIANVFHHLKQKRTGRPVVPMEYMGEEYFKLKASIIKYERFVLRDLGFCVHVRNPHKLIIAYLQILELEKNRQLAQRAWNFMNDSLRTNVFVRFLPETISCSCIFLAARQLKIPLPQRPPWWTVFEVTYEDIEAVCLELLALYRKPRLFLMDLEKKLNVLKDKYAKKQIEIKEVNLKKTVSTNSPANSPKQDSDGQQEKDKDNSSSLILDSKLQPSPLTTQTTALNSSQPNSNNVSSLTNNNHSTKMSPSPPPKANRSRRSSRSVSPPPLKKRKTTSPISHRLSLPATLKKRKSSPPGRRISPPTSNRKKNASSSRSKVIISPIRVASSGESVSEDSVSPRENGLPEQYRKNYNKRSSSNHSRHRSRHGHRTSPYSRRDRRYRDDGGRRRGHERSKSRRSDQDRYNR